MTGGTVRSDLLAYDSSTITMGGGMVGGDVIAYGSSTITITGTAVLATPSIHQQFR